MMRWRWQLGNFEVTEATDKIASIGWSYDGIDEDNNGVAFQHILSGTAILTTDVIFTGVTKEQCYTAILISLDKTLEELQNPITEIVNQKIDKSNNKTVINKPNPFEGVA